jgi:DNA recombination protein RmuC
MKKLADHIRQANQDVEEVNISSRKISQRFARIDAVELDAPQEERPVLVSGGD